MGDLIKRLKEHLTEGVVTEEYVLDNRPRHTHTPSPGGPPVRGAMLAAARLSAPAPRSARCAPADAASL